MIESGCTNFNALFGNMCAEDNTIQIYAYSSETSKLRCIYPDEAVFSLCNGCINSNWPKQQKGKEMILDLLKSNALNPENLFSVLT